MRIDELIPKGFREVALIAYKKQPNYLRGAIDKQGKECIQVHTGIQGFLNSIIDSELKLDYRSILMFYAVGRWLAEGPKTFCPTVEQCEVLENVSVNLSLADYSQPYPCLLVELPKGRYAPFEMLLLHWNTDTPKTPFLVNSMYSKGGYANIANVVVSSADTLENLALKFSSECQDVEVPVSKALRVALNSCLVLTNYSTALSWRYPIEWERDERLGRENTERGARARERLQTSEQILTFSQEVVLHGTETARSSHDPSGREVTSHWRRGHWAMQPYGPNHSLRKRIFRAPVFVRADLFGGDAGDTTVTYRG